MSFFFLLTVLFPIQYKNQKLAALHLLNPSVWCFFFYREAVNRGLNVLILGRRIDIINSVIMWNFINTTVPCVTEDSPWFCSPQTSPKSWAAQQRLWRRATWSACPLTPSTAWRAWLRARKQSGRPMTSRGEMSKSHWPSALAKFRTFISEWEKLVLLLVHGPAVLRHLLI